MDSSKAAPTGCYKCGRPGHWSRDCPDSDPNTDSVDLNSNSARSIPINPKTNLKPAAGQPKKVPKSRPKLTPEILLGDDGLGYVLRYFPRNFKYRGRGHEVSDLGNLIRLYSEWHKRLLPYFSFEEFVHKVEQVASTKRVRTCLKDLRERVATGGDPTKLHELATESADPNLEHDNSNPVDEGMNDSGGQSSMHLDVDNEQEDMLRDIFDKATQEPPNTSHISVEQPTQNSNASTSSKVSLTDEQKARMEANRLKALERAAARARSLQKS